jgi:hypothetical protein
MRRRYRPRLHWRARKQCLANLNYTEVRDFLIEYMGRRARST